MKCWPPVTAASTRREGGKRLFYDVASKSYKPVPRAEGLIVLADLPESSIVWKNSARHRARPRRRHPVRELDAAR